MPTIVEYVWCSAIHRTFQVEVTSSGIVFGRLIVGRQVKPWYKLYYAGINSKEVHRFDAIPRDQEDYYKWNVRDGNLMLYKCSEVDGNGRVMGTPVFAITSTTYSRSNLVDSYQRQLCSPAAVLLS
jgi:hypothetical protein